MPVGEPALPAASQRTRTTLSPETGELHRGALALGFDTETFEGQVKVLCCSDGTFIEGNGTDRLLAWLYEKVRVTPHDYAVFYNLGFDGAAIVWEFVVREQERLRGAHYRKLTLQRELTFLTAKRESEPARFSLEERARTKELLLELDGLETVERFDTDRFHVTLIGSKGFSVKPLAGGKKKGAAWFFDTSPFYSEGHGAMSLDRASRKFLGEHKSAEEEGIDRARIGEEAGYYEAHREAIIRYCVQDARLTARLMERTVDAFERLGFPFPKRPFSKGSVSKEILKRNGALDTTQARYERLEKSAYRGFWEKAYQGGVFLLLGAGTWEGVYALDINSAYPWGMLQFPSLEDAEVVDREDPRFERAFFRFYRIRLKPTPRTPRRERGTLRKLYGWSDAETDLYVTGPDLEALDAWGDPYEVVEACGVWCPSPVHPFRYLEEVFRIKSEAKRTYGAESVEYMNAKTVANGSYGITAQQRPRKGRFTNLIYAAYTTALCRRELWRAAHEVEAAGDYVLQYATDGLLVHDRTGGRVRELWRARSSKKIGEWEFTAWERATLFETGVYLLEGLDRVEHLKKRGAPDLTPEVLRRCQQPWFTSRRSAPLKLRSGLLMGRAREIGKFLLQERTICPAQSFADAGQSFPRDLGRRGLCHYFTERWELRLSGDPRLGAIEPGWWRAGRRIGATPLHPTLRGEKGLTGMPPDLAEELGGLGHPAFAVARKDPEMKRRHVRMKPTPWRRLLAMGGEDGVR